MGKKFILIFIVILFIVFFLPFIRQNFYSVQAQSSSLNIPSNTWTKLTPITTNTGGLGGSYNDRAYTTASYDSIGKRVIYWDGYVNDSMSCPRRYTIYSNGIWGFDAASKNLTLLKVNNWTNPASDWTTSACPENSTDPTPANRHPAFAYVSDKNSIYISGGLNIRIAGRNSVHPDDTWKFNLSTNSWTQLFPALSPVPNSEPWPAMVYDPSARKIVLVDAPSSSGGDYTWLFNVDTETFEMLSSTPRPYMGASTGNTLAYDSSRQRVWLFGAGGATYDVGGNELWQFNTSAKVWTKINPTGTLPPNRIYHGFAYISKYDVFMLYGGATKGDGGVNLTDTWIYSPATNSWTQLSVSSPTSDKFIDMVYDEANDAIIVHTGVDTIPEWWAFRYVPVTSDTTPPTTPTNLSATAVSTSQINLTWTASADTGGSGLAGYRVYRCQGTGCTPSTQIATAITNSYSDTGLSANTTYVYRVAAYDAASPANVSGQSSSASATTQSASGSCTSPATNPSTVIAETSMARPSLLTATTDVDFPCTTFARVTNSPSGTISVPLYSQLQAWNSNQSLLLLNTDSGYKILNANTYQIVHTIDWGWPDWGQAPRWSPTEPYVLYYIDDSNSFCSAAALMRYRLNSSNLSLRTRELVRCFPEYSSFLKDQSWEELSLDGRYIALMGVKVSNGRNEIFAYDVINNVKYNTLELPVGRDCDHVQPSPLGNYVVLTCGAGTTGFNGVEIYDKNMNYLRNLHLYTDHSDLAVDQNNVEWLMVFDNQTGNGAVAKKRLSDGYRVDLIVPSTPSWQGSHISCQSPRTGWCTYSTVRNAANGWEAREGEIIKIYLDSTVSVPHLERLAHHRSDPIYTGDGSPDNCPTVDRYWTDPHQTSNPNGSKIIFGSSWGQNCFVESYVINLGSSSDVIPPAVPTGLVVS